MLPLERRAFGTPACFCETGREGESLLYSRLQHAYLELCDSGCMHCACTLHVCTSRASLESSCILTNVVTIVYAAFRAACFWDAGVPLRTVERENR